MGKSRKPQKTEEAAGSEATATGWTISVKKKVDKELSKLPVKVRELVALLLKDIELGGPVRGDWPNYSKLGGDKHHCHIKDGRPSYVACWEVTDKTVRIVEVYYVGTRENAPY